MRRSLVTASAASLLVAIVGAHAGGCSSEVVSTNTSTSSSGSGGATGTSTTSTTSSSSTTSTSTSSTTSSSSTTSGSVTSSSSSGAVDARPSPPGCGPVELCDPDHLGFDDNCDGQVDEGCACVSGQAHFCFKGDPWYHSSPGCYDGTELCTPQGTWGPCLGGFRRGRRHGQPLLARGRRVLRRGPEQHLLHGAADLLGRRHEDAAPHTRYQRDEQFRAALSTVRPP